MLTILLSLFACAELDAGESRDIGEPQTLSTSAEDLDEMRLLMEAALSDNSYGATGMTWVVVDDEGETVTDISVGSGTDLTTHLMVASSAKLVTAIVLLRLDFEGVLPLDSRVEEAFGCAGDTCDITVDQLGALTSGLPSTHACIGESETPLDECAMEILAEPLTHAPGTHFAYSPTHMTVAAAMAEWATGLSWQELVQVYLLDELEIPPEALVFIHSGDHDDTSPLNPTPAGGLRTNPRRYLAVMNLVLQGGWHTDSEGATRQLIEPDRLYENHYPGVSGWGQSTGVDHGDDRYSFGAWLTCPDAETSCESLASPGSLGFTPWLDDAHRGMGVLAMQASAGAGDFSIPLATSLRAVLLD